MKTGLVKIRGRKAYFSPEGWDILKSVARRQHKTPKQVFHVAIRRHLRALKKGEVL